MNFTIQFNLNMKGKTRRTKDQKLKTSERKAGFVIKNEWLTNKKPKVNIINSSSFEGKYFRQDLTKTFVLTMLVLALELALWHYLSRQ